MRLQRSTIIMKKEKKFNKRLEIRLTVNEHKKWIDEAANQGQTLTDFIKHAVEKDAPYHQESYLKYRTEIFAEYKKCVQGFGLTGSNANQIARFLNTYDKPIPGMDTYIKLLHKTLEEVIQINQKIQKMIS